MAVVSVTIVFGTSEEKKIATTPKVSRQRGNAWGGQMASSMSCRAMSTVASRYQNIKGYQGINAETQRLGRTDGLKYEYEHSRTLVQCLTIAAGPFWIMVPPNYFLGEVPQIFSESLLKN